MTWSRGLFVLVALYLLTCISLTRAQTITRHRIFTRDHRSTGSTSPTQSIIATTFKPIQKVNPPLLCPFTNQGAFIVGPGTPCSSYTDTNGVTAIVISTITVDPTFLFLPFVPCATLPVQSYYLPGDLGIDCSFAVISGQSTVTISTPSVPGPCLTTTTYTTMCVYPRIVTIFSGPDTEIFLTDATAFIDIPTFMTTTNIFSATVTISSTRTSRSTTTTVTTNTVTVQAQTTTTLSATSTITFSRDVFVDVTESTTTTTLAVSTSVSLSVSSVLTTVTESITDRVTRTTCPQNSYYHAPNPYPNNPKRQLPKIVPTPFFLRQDRIEQVQCPVPYAGSVYNSNIGSSISTVCNVAGAVQLLTSATVYNTWLWSMIKTYTPCAYAATDTVFWIASTTGTCFALQSTTTTTRPCSEIHPVVCINQTGTPLDLNQSTVSTITGTVTIFVTTGTTTVTRVTTVMLTANRSQISSVIITVPTFTTTTRTSTRNSLVTSTSTISTTNTAYSLTTSTSSITETVDTATIVSTLFVLTRTVTEQVTTTVAVSTTSTTVTTVTDVVASCPITVTRTITFSTTFSTAITNVVPVLVTTVYTTESQCFVPETTTWATSGCGCADAS